MLKKIFIGFFILLLIGVIGLFGTYQYWKSQMPPWPERLNVDFSVPEYNHIKMEEVKPDNAAYYIYQLTESPDEQIFLEEGKSYGSEEFLDILSEIDREEAVDRFNFFIFDDVDYENWNNELEAKIDAEIAKSPETFNILEKALACRYCEFAIRKDFLRQAKVHVPFYKILEFSRYYFYLAKKSFKKGHTSNALNNLNKVNKLMELLINHKPSTLSSEKVIKKLVETSVSLLAAELGAGIKNSNLNELKILLLKVPDSNFSLADFQKNTIKDICSEMQRGYQSEQEAQLITAFEKCSKDLSSYLITSFDEYDKKGAFSELPSQYWDIMTYAAKMTDSEITFVSSMLNDGFDRDFNTKFVVAYINNAYYGFRSIKTPCKIHEFIKSKLCALKLMVEAGLYREKFELPPKEVSVLYSNLFKEKDFLRAKTSGNPIKYEVIDGEISISVDHPLYSEQNFSIKL